MERKNRESGIQSWTIVLCNSIILHATNLRLCDKRWKRDFRLHHVIYIRLFWTNEFRFWCRNFSRIENVSREEEETNMKRKIKSGARAKRTKKKRKYERKKCFEEKSLRKQLIFAAKRIIVATQLSKVNY